MAGKAKVVLTDYVWESLDVEKKILAGLADLVPMQTKKPEEFLFQAADCDALLNTYAGPITADAMANMPKCKIIARYGIGVDTIDLEAATRAGIIVTNNPTYCIEEVAEHTMALLLDSARKIAFYDRLVRAGTWAVPPGKPLYRLVGRTLGLVGFGNIARQVAVRAAAFGETHARPTHVRHGEIGPEPRHAAGQEAESGDSRRLVAVFEQQLQPEANAEQWPAGASDVADRIAEAALGEAALGGCEVADAGHDHAIRRRGADGDGRQDHGQPRGQYQAHPLYCL